MPRREDEELLAAYLDGVAELTPDERKRAEAAASPAELEATRALLGKLRAMPPASSEPDWTAMERSISLAVGQRIPRPWWSISWRWAAPVIACAAAAIAIVVVTRPDTVAEPVAHVQTPKPTVEHPDSAPMVYLDGEATDIDAVDPAALDDLEETPDIADEENLIPNDHWIDQLDDRALDRAEQMLKRKKS
jgi:hypothetical protein